MANEEQLERLKQGVQGWNIWRAKNLERIDLTHADLAHADLAHANLSMAYLIGANLSGANLSWAHLTRARLSSANLSGANLIGTNFTGADLTGANLSRANLFGAHFTGANLIEANLIEANLNMAYLIGTDLSGANLIGAHLTEANLSHSLLSSTVFAENDLTSVKGLDTIRHQDPSRIDFCTVTFPSPGLILATFLRGGGFSEYLVEALHGRILPFQPAPPVKVFASFAPSDQKLCQDLRDHLSLLVRLEMIVLSHEAVLPSDIHQWETKISAALEEAQVILLLVSAQFLASHQAWKDVIKPALHRHQQEGVRLIPIILRPTDWKESPLEKLQSLPIDGRPVTEWEHIDTPLTQVSESIRKVVESLHETLTEQAMKQREHDLVMAKLILTKTQVAEKQGTIQKQKQAVKEAEKTCQALQAQLSEAQHHHQDLFQVQETLLADLALLEHASTMLDEEVRTLDTQLHARQAIVKGMTNETGR